MMKRLLRRKNGFVFSLDMAIAVLVAILVLSAAHRHMINAEANKISNAYMAAEASDIVAVLDYSGVLQTLDEAKTEAALTGLLPQNLNMMLRVSADDDTVIYAGTSLPEQQFVATGKRFFTIKDGNSIGNYAYVTYWVWTR